MAPQEECECSCQTRQRRPPPWPLVVFDTHGALHRRLADSLDHPCRRLGVEKGDLFLAVGLGMTGGVGLERRGIPGEVIGDVVLSYKL